MEADSIQKHVQSRVDELPNYFSFLRDFLFPLLLVGHHRWRKIEVRPAAAHPAPSIFIHFLLVSVVREGRIPLDGL